MLLIAAHEGGPPSCLTASLNEAGRQLTSLRLRPGGQAEGSSSSYSSEQHLPHYLAEFGILEVSGSAAKVDDNIATQQHWKKKLQSLEMGLSDFRYNNRIKLGVNDVDRTTNMLKGIVGKRVTYRRISEGKAAWQAPVDECRDGGLRRLIVGP